MKRIIIDYKKLTPEMAGLLFESYPQGYGDEDIISFKNVKGEWVEAVELQTSEALYLVKVSTNLTSLLSNFFDNESETDVLEVAEPIFQPFENEYDGSLESKEGSEH
jgi:DNA-directed RNA polymerase subunit delta